MVPLGTAGNVGMFEYEYEDLRLTLRDYPASDHLVVKEVFEQNNYGFDPSQIKVGLVIDLGANIGAFSCLVGQYARVLAYEPESRNFELLLKNIIQNPVDVIPYQLAVGREGTSTIDDLQACSRLGMPGEAVRVVSINSILDPLGDVDILKFDVEGGEYEIFEEITEENILKCRRIVGEFHPPVADRYAPQGIVIDLEEPYRKGESCSNGKGMERYDSVIHNLEKTHYLENGGYTRKRDPMNVDLGCGMRKVPGWIGIDIRPFRGVDFVLDLERDKLPFEDDTIDSFKAIHLFEHFTPEGLFWCIEECWRCLRPTGRFYISVPKAGTPAWYVHPDHKIHFIEDTFAFFQVPAEGKDPHGYLKHFWHVAVLDAWEQEIKVYMYPNKKGSPHYPYQEVGSYL